MTIPVKLLIKFALLVICVLIWYAESRAELKDIMSEYVLPKGKKE